MLHSVGQLVDCPVTWDGHTFTVYDERLTPGIQTRLSAVKEDCGLEDMDNGEMHGKVTDCNAEGHILCQFDAEGAGVFNIAVPQGMYIVVY